MEMLPRFQRLGVLLLLPFLLVLSTARAADGDIGLLRPPPPGITYESTHRDARGLIAVVLGGQGRGFNLVTPEGSVIVASRLKWNREPSTAIVELLPHSGGRGFIGVSHDGRRWELGYSLPNYVFDAKEVARAYADRLTDAVAVVFAAIEGLENEHFQRTRQEFRAVASRS